MNKRFSKDKDNDFIRLGKLIWWKHLVEAQGRLDRNQHRAFMALWYNGYYAWLSIR